MGLIIRLLKLLYWFTIPVFICAVLFSHRGMPHEIAWTFAGLLSFVYGRYGHNLIDKLEARYARTDLPSQSLV